VQNPKLAVLLIAHFSRLTAHRSRSLQLVDLAVKEGKNRIKPDGLVYSAGSAR